MSLQCKVNKVHVNICPVVMQALYSSFSLNKSVLLALRDKEFQACSVTVWPSSISTLHPERVCYVTATVCVRCRSPRRSYSSGEAWWPSAWCSTPRLHAPNPITGSWCGSCPGVRPRTCTAATAAHQSCPRSPKTAGVRGTQWTCTQSSSVHCSD